jgi:hypothetical protein
MEGLGPYSISDMPDGLLAFGAVIIIVFFVVMEIINIVDWIKRKRKKN